MARPARPRARRPTATTSGARGRGRVVVMLLAVLAGVPVSCGRATDTGAGGDCAQARTTSPPRSNPRGPRTGPAGAAGSARVLPHSAPPAAAPSPSPPPAPVHGRLALTAANTSQTIVVPADTLIDVRLEPVSGLVWTLPESSDPLAMPRVSASGACYTVKTATFRAVRGGEIIASRPHADSEARLIVTIRVAG